MSRPRRVRRILLAQRDVGGVPRFPAQVLWFAEEQGARLHLVNVVRTGAAAAVVRERERWLEQLANKAREKGLGATTQVRSGEPHMELIREAVATKANIVVAVEQERAATLGFAGTTLELLRSCPCPVWVIRSPLKRSKRRIMAAVDLGPRGSASNRPNTRILEVAARFARTEGAKLFVFHAWSPGLREEIRLREPNTAAETELSLWDARIRQKRRLEALTKRTSLDDIDIEARLEDGFPGTLVPEVTRQLETDILVMSTFAVPRATKGAVGHTAEKIFDKLGCSVVAVKPEGSSSAVPVD